VRNMAVLRMLVDGDGRAVTPEEAVASWREVAGKVMPICTLLALAAVGEG